MKKYSLSALAAVGLLAGGLSAGSASAADLGGNCCADLEERVAELEATVARKGNRKVSLTISGWIAEQVMWWDDGVESNAYVGGVGTTLASHFKLTGSAKINSDWSAGYILHVEAIAQEPLAANQANDDTGARVGVLQSAWYIKSETLGKLTVGQQSHASDNTAILVDGSGSLVPANWVNFDTPAFRARTAGALNGFTWGTIGHCHGIGLGIGGDCNGVPDNAVRYDSPTFAGFSVSASWGEDDMWDVAARYAGEFSGFKLAVAAAYNEITDNNIFRAGERAQYFQIGAYLQHVPSGVFVYGAYGTEQSNVIDPLRDGNGGEQYLDGDHWYVKAGIRQRWTPLGHTVVYGEYQQRNDMLDPTVIDAADTVNNSSEMTMWGVGIVQEIDAAAMSIWLTYRHLDGEVTLGGANTKFDDFDLIKFGALIAF